MMKAIIILSLIIIFCNVTMDEIQFHWNRLFAYVFPGKLAQWFNPEMSWRNKYTDSKIITFLFSTIFVMLTDFWHLLKFIMLNCIFAIILILIGDIPTGDFILFMAGLNLGWGITYEIIKGIYGFISDYIT